MTTEQLSLPPGWVARESSSHPGSIYFFNEFSRTSRWEKPTAEDAALPTQVRASHILYKHTGSRNPVSRRTNERISRTPEEAIAGLESIQAKLAEDPSKFEDIAQAESDDSSFKRGGDLGKFGRGMMQKPFEDAAFHLAVNEISGIIQSDSGFHIIKRTA
ncbi:Peptidyl-prolyl cis-trans isomerase [Hondaea fermentalgiana]|uniref:Peptidyl-prolyl cis-trans isomerase n=1 Tax=Hondaea fermentalgiana TaxID=2315210 RepID=A0A2R5FZ84_9STRA|nr:Peptidyl-prolyl cis-trans isomerase [Hondaea fermentalgiana]|eukprot:GBG24040.1 Peptidyl-prolyl cis-trans isomerase [Hondaea fermentalgiana]